MNAKQLNSFIRAAELKSFSKAAKEFGLSSPALISQINTIEKEYGISLFNRSTHSIKLTPQGVVFYNAAKEMLDVYYRFQKECADLSKKKELRIATSGSQIMELNDFVYEFKKKHPDYNVHFETLDPTEITERLKYGKVHCCYCAEPLDVVAESNWFAKVYSNPFYVAMGKDHPLASADLVTAEDLKKYGVETWARPLRKVDPAQAMLNLGIPTVCHDETLTTMEVLNQVLNEKVVLCPYMVPAEQLGCICIKKTDINAGNFGFAVSKDVEPIITEFITNYISQRQART